MEEGAAARAMRRLDAAPTRLTEHGTRRRLGWLWVTVAAVLLLAVAPAVSVVYAVSTDGLDQWPLLVSIIPTAMLAYWVIGGSYLRYRREQPAGVDRAGSR
jgi:hypothetical protein